MKTQMFRAVDREDNRESLFAVRYNEMSVSSYSWVDDPWLNKRKFGEIDDWAIEKLDKSRMIDPELMWEK